MPILHRKNTDVAAFSRRSSTAISVGHFIATPLSSVGNVWVGRFATTPPDSTPRMRVHQPYIL